MTKMMIIPSAFLLAIGLLAQTGAGLFSVHDDLLAFPQVSMGTREMQCHVSDSFGAQYEVLFPESFVTPSEVEAMLSESRARPASSNRQQQPLGGVPADDPADDFAESYELMRMSDRSFLCAIPIVRSPPPMNATEKELSKVEEEKELARATTRGWELLSDLEGKCLYFVSGWWSYSFCHNREVRQFHQLPPQQNNQWPPTEDPETQSYVLGQAAQDGTRNSGEGTELQATGELRYLVQKFGGGTICDLTGKERKIEIQVYIYSLLQLFVSFAHVVYPVPL